MNESKDIGERRIAQSLVEVAERLESVVDSMPEILGLLHVKKSDVKLANIKVGSRQLLAGGAIEASH
ncbi:hypothetical protein [Mitsuaria sp. 7]|uniref:hypothetical protein n=1 Tax=Mitsuaria sp. 7 TaxID=1658665 RepID=UPI0012F7BD72|nr:hypothetical protein [Mitsuaria sp. 7]